MHIKSLKELKALNENQYKKVHHIDLSYEPISVMPPEIYKCINLVKLNLQNTYIQIISGKLLKFKKLHSIFFPKTLTTICSECDTYDYSEISYFLDYNSKLNYSKQGEW